jgi:hypothetical protein
VPGVIDTTAGSASTMTSAPGTDRPTPAPPAAKAGVGVVAGSALITPRERAASTFTGPSTTAAGHGHVPQFIAPSSYLRRRTYIRSPLAPTEPKPLSPLDRDQLQGLVCVHLFVSLYICLVSSHPSARTPVQHPTWGTRASDDRRYLELKLISCLIECHSRFPQSSHQLRCSTLLVSTHRPRYRSPH